VNSPGSWAGGGGGGGGGAEGGGGGAGAVSTGGGGGGGVKGGGGGGADYARKNILDPRKYPFGNQQCAEKVREAVEYATGKTLKRPTSVQAKDYGDGLKDIDFEPVIGAQKGHGYPPRSYSGLPYVPQEGDVIVIQDTSKSRAGHMAIYAGKNSSGREIWISDFIQQRGPYPGESYRAEKPAYVIYRYRSRRQS